MDSIFAEITAIARDIKSYVIDLDRSGFGGNNPVLFNTARTFEFKLRKHDDVFAQYSSMQRNVHELLQLVQDLRNSKASAASSQMISEGYVRDLEEQLDAISDAAHDVRTHWRNLDLREILHTVFAQNKPEQVLNKITQLEYSDLVSQALKILYEYDVDENRIDFEVEKMRKLPAPAPTRATAATPLTQIMQRFELQFTELQTLPKLLASYGVKTKSSNWRDIAMLCKHNLLVFYKTYPQPQAHRIMQVISDARAHEINEYHAPDVGVSEIVIRRARTVQPLATARKAPGIVRIDINAPSTLVFETLDNEHWRAAHATRALHPSQHLAAYNEICSTQILQNLENVLLDDNLNWQYLKSEESRWHGVRVRIRMQLVADAQFKGNAARALDAALDADKIANAILKLALENFTPAIESLDFLQAEITRRDLSTIIITTGANLVEKIARAIAAQRAEFEPRNIGDARNAFAEILDAVLVQFINSKSSMLASIKNQLDIIQRGIGRR